MKIKNIKFYSESHDDDYGFIPSPFDFFKRHMNEKYGKRNEYKPNTMSCSIEFSGITDPYKFMECLKIMCQNIDDVKLLTWSK